MPQACLRLNIGTVGKNFVKATVRCFRDAFASWLLRSTQRLRVVRVVRRDVVGPKESKRCICMHLLWIAGQQTGDQR